MSLPQERSTAEQVFVFYTWVARSRSGSSFTALAVKTLPPTPPPPPAGPVSYTWVARLRSESTSQFTALALNKAASSSCGE